LPLVPHSVLTSKPTPLPPPPPPPHPPPHTHTHTHTHPHPHTQAESKFSDIGQAYETLSKPDLKQIYDREGEEGLKKKGHQGGGGQDIFQSMFGGDQG
jgi:DnaJ-class molecular chaperone